MRGAFATTLAELAETDPRILLLTGDLGYMALEPFADRFPKRFFNVGVAEQNMVGLATGLAEAGFIPFVYSIVTFATLRPYEFIRNGPIQHQLPVRIVGIGGGFEYGQNGLSHYGLEDVSVMRAQPGMTIIAPSDFEQARSSLLATWDLPGPVYYRLGKDDKTRIPGLSGRFELKRLQRIGEGKDLLIVASGSVANEAVAAVEDLRIRGVSASVAIIASVTPAPFEDLKSILSEFPTAMSVEAQYINGGVGSLVAEVIAEQGLNCRLIRCGVKSLPNGITGTQQFMNHLNGISREALVETAMGAMRDVGGLAKWQKS